jgi:ubiquinone/menaquinone biosynthesis C-methylase UbiE
MQDRTVTAWRDNLNIPCSCAEQTVSSEVYDENYYWEQDGPGGWRRFLETGGQQQTPGEGYLRSLGQLKDGMRVLDIGCGRGEFVLRCVQDHQLFSVGLDYSAAAVKVARDIVYQFGTEEQKTRMLFIRADAQRIPFADKSYDVIFSHHVVEHLYPDQLERMLRECHRLLKDGGLLVFETAPNLWRLRYGFPITRLAYRFLFLGDVYCRIMGVKEIPRQAKTSEDAMYHVGEQSVPSLKRVLQRNGFEFKVWVGLGTDSRFTREAFQKRFGRMGYPLYYLYYLVYGTFPFNLIFDDIIYALAWPVRSRI